MKQLEQIIEKQRRGKEDLPEYAIGEQLKDMARRNPVYVQILKADLCIDEMNLSAAAEKLKEYADKHHEKKEVFCITPKTAEKIILDFYKLPECHEAPPDAVSADDIRQDARSADTIEKSYIEESYIDIGDFL